MSSTLWGLVFIFGILGFCVLIQVIDKHWRD